MNFYIYVSEENRDKLIIPKQNANSSAQELFQMIKRSYP